MKTPRFFIALTACAIAFTIASSSLEGALRIASAQTLPVLRADPWMGDPDSPGAPREMPFDEGLGELRSSVTYETSGPQQSLTTTRPGASPWRSYEGARWFVVFLQVWGWRW